MKKIGILSGMGASAGARFYNLLIEECQRQGAKQDCDFPEAVIYNVSSKGMNETGICNERIIKSDILKALYQLDFCKVDLVIMACNSVHEHLDYFQGQTKALILDMVGLTQAKYGENVGVVCSRSTRKSSLYRGIQVNDEQQTVIDSMIGRVMSGSYSKSQLADDKFNLMGIIDSLIGRGAGTVILGCTELPLITTRRLAVVDPAEIVIKEALCQ